MTAPTRSFYLPECLERQQTINRTIFLRWLTRKAKALVTRDRKRGRIASVSEYKWKILRAVEESHARDYYTGEELEWSLVSKWNDNQAKAGGAAYRRKFFDLPSVDHDSEEFRICSWQMNDSKSDQTIKEFLDLAARVHKHRRAN